MKCGKGSKIRRYVTQVRPYTKKGSPGLNGYVRRYKWFDSVRASIREPWVRMDMWNLEQATAVEHG